MFETNAELYALMKHQQICKRWFHGKKCVESAMTDMAFYGLIKEEK
jgi:hypothetical protein